MVTAAAHMTESDLHAHMTRIDNTYRSVSYSHSSLLAIYSATRHKAGFLLPYISCELNPFDVVSY